VLFKPTSTPQAESSWKKRTIAAFKNKNETFLEKKPFQPLGSFYRKKILSTLQEFFLKN